MAALEQTAFALARSSVSSIVQLHGNLCCQSLPRKSPGAGSSLPQSPDQDDDHSCPRFPPAADPLYLSTSRLVRGFVREFALGSDPPSSGLGWLAGKDRAAGTLKSMGRKVIDKHRAVFTGIVNRLNISDRGDLNAIEKVGTEMFSDGEMNWGRVVSFIAFGAVMGERLADMQMQDLIDLVAEEITQYLTQQKREWLQKHNGWDGFTEFFEENDLEDSTKKVLMVVASVGLAGAGILHWLR
uniref:Myeloid cell leukemia sequence 1 (BCL2-related) n=2 Tax=Callorhinchus milii TaxID=7868 RepID=V9KZ48_CALMI|eukprot:gi/632989062/ref/XP_007883445.1/ PREDICTED: induced myeloid leukemia cell differentiation protein Mcl-1 homolog [Callorhinchus milii]